MSERKSATAYRTISEVAEGLGVPQHVLRFWETKFPAVKPLKRGGNRRYYRPEDIELLQVIHRLLHVDGYTIKGAQKLLKERGARALVEELLGGDKPDTKAGSLPQASAPDAAEAEAEAALAEAGIPEALTVDPDAVELVAASDAAEAEAASSAEVAVAAPVATEAVAAAPREADRAVAEPVGAAPAPQQPAPQQKAQGQAQAVLVAELKSIRARLAGALGETVPAAR